MHRPEATHAQQSAHAHPYQHPTSTGVTGVKPSHCRKFDYCNAPYCPLDPNRAAIETRYREPSCTYLREAVKHDGCVPEAMRSAVDEAVTRIRSGQEGGVYLCRVLERASHHGSSVRGLNSSRKTPEKAPRSA